MIADFKKAVIEDTNLVVAFAGPSGSGKTYSAMLAASGICGDEPFAVIDTEAKRALHYADQFNFEHFDMRPPFTPEKYTKAVADLEARGFKAIVIDSMSHEYDGEGGICEMADNYTGKPGPGAWKDPKKRHKKMVGKFLQSRTHLIFCLRADEKIDMSKKDDRGKIIVTSQGWVPICEKRFMYEMTVSFTFAPGCARRCRHDPTPQMPRSAPDEFPPGQHITKEAGAMLAAWARGEAIESPDKALWDRARINAHEGMEALKLYYNTVLTDAEKAKLKPIGAELNRLAKTADSNRGEI